MPTIRSLYSSVDNLSDRLSSAIHTIESEIRHLASERQRQNSIVKSGKDLVIAGDQGRYASLTAVAITAGTDQDFSRLATQWQQEAETNRAQKDALEREHGKSVTLAAEATRLQGLFEGERLQLDQCNTEIGAFEKVSKNITDHNKKFPNSQITKDNHDDYEVFSWMSWRCLKAFAGSLFRYNPGPYEAFQVLGKFTEEHGDFYEKADTIAKTRQKQSDLETSSAEKSAKLTSLNSVLSKMNALDQTYRSPDSIADQIGTMVNEAIANKDGRFARALFQSTELGGLTKAVPALGKAKALGALEQTADDLLREVQSTRADFNAPKKKLDNARSDIPGESISFDMDSVERTVNARIEDATNVCAAIALARSAIAQWQTPAGMTYDRVMSDLEGLGNKTFRLREANTDFTRLNRAVGAAVERYEEEQRRIREEETRIQREREAAARRARAEEAERERLANAAAVAAAAAAATILTSRNEERGGLSRQTDNVFGGDEGIRETEVKSDNVFGGDDGIAEDSNRQDDVFGGDSGVADPSP